MYRYVTQIRHIFLVNCVIDSKKLKFQNLIQQ